MLNKRLLITGATGMLGFELAKVFHFNSKYQVFSVSRKFTDKNENQIRVDLSNEKELQVVLGKIQPQIIIHCAAEVNVNKCEIEKEYTYNLHVNATRNLVQYASVEKFIYISTDSVFDGQRGNYLESDTINPLNYYASTKLKGEEVVTSANKNTFVLRTNIIGYHVPLQGSLFEWAYQNLAAKIPINGYENVYFNPLYSGILAEKISEFAEQQYDPGIYHIGAADTISKFEFVKKIAMQFNLDETLIKPVILDSKPDNGAIRPLNTTLNIGKVQNLGITMPSMAENISLLYHNFKKTFA